MTDMIDHLAPSPSPAAASAAPDPVVSILVISYNTKAMTLACLQSVVEQTRLPYEVILLDNNSPDGSAAAIAAAFPQIRLIASRENHGFAKGNNLAAREARGKYLLLLNPDTLVLDQAVDRLVAFAERTPGAGIWGGRTLKEDRTLDPGCCMGDQTLWSLLCLTSGLTAAFRGSPVFNSEHYGGWNRDSEREIAVVQGCFLLIRRELWDRLGGFDLTFVMYGEEVDLCRRARDFGARPRMSPEPTIVHYTGASSKLRSDRVALVIRSRITLAQRYLPTWQRRPAVLLLRLWPLSRWAGFGLAARLTGNARAAELARHWRAVWETRAGWQDGFPVLPHAAPSSSA